MCYKPIGLAPRPLSKNFLPTVIPCKKFRFCSLICWLVLPVYWNFVGVAIVRLRPSSIPHFLQCQEIRVPSFIKMSYPEFIYITIFLILLTILTIFVILIILVYKILLLLLLLKLIRCYKQPSSEQNYYSL